MRWPIHPVSLAGGDGEARNPVPEAAKSLKPGPDRQTGARKHQTVMDGLWLEEPKGIVGNP